MSAWRWLYQLCLGLAGLVLAAPPAPAGAQTPPPLEAFARLPALDQVKLSPDGERLAMLVTAEDGRRHVALAPVGDPQSRRLVRLPEDAIPLDLRWGNADWLLASLAAPAEAGRGDRLRQQVYKIRPDEGRLRLAMDKPAPGGHSLRAQRVRDRRAPQSKLVDVLAGEPDTVLLAAGQSPDLPGWEVRRVDLETGRARTVLPAIAGLHTFLADADGEVRLAWGSGEEGIRILFRSKEDGDWHDLSDAIDVHAGYSPVGYAADGGLLVLRPAEDGMAAIHRFDPETGRWSEPLHRVADREIVATVSVRASGEERLIGYRYAEHAEVSVYLTPAWQRRQQRLDEALPETVNRIVSSARGMHRHVVLARSDVRPGAYYLYEDEGGRQTLIGRRYPELEPEALSPMKPVRYEARDGAEIPAYLTLPQPSQTAERPLPAIIWVHGGPHSRIYRRFDFVAQFLASRGYAVLQPNFRGSSGYGQPFLAAGYEEWGRAMQDDIADAARWLIDRGIADPERLCIGGGSYGGYAALMGAAKTPALWRCAVSLNGVSDLPQLLGEQDERVNGVLTVRSIGGGDLKRISPAYRAGDIAAPVLLVHSRDDRIVPVGHARRMAEALEEVGQPVQLTLLDGGGHGLITEQARRRFLQALDSFLAANLGSGA